MNLYLICVFNIYIVVATRAIGQAGNTLRSQYSSLLNNNISFCQMECHSMVAAMPLVLGSGILCSKKHIMHSEQLLFGVLSNRVIKKKKTYLENIQQKPLKGKTLWFRLILMCLSSLCFGLTLVPH